MNKLLLCIVALLIAAVYAVDITPINTITTDGAISAAQAVLQAARKGGHKVAVSVIDRNGKYRLLISDDNAGPQTEESAKRKAFTAVSFGQPTSKLTAAASGTNVTIHDIPGTLFLAGGVPIIYEEVPIGAIGVGGAPNGEIDEQYANAGIAALGL